MHTLLLAAFGAKGFAWKLFALFLQWNALNFCCGSFLSYLWYGVLFIWLMVIFPNCMSSQKQNVSERERKYVCVSLWFWVPVVIYDCLPHMLKGPLSWCICNSKSNFTSVCILRCCWIALIRIRQLISPAANGCVCKDIFFLEKNFLNLCLAC